MVWPSAPAAAFRTDGVREPPLALARSRAFGLDPAEASFARRRFVATDLARQERLEQIGRTFIAGYNAAVRMADPVAIVNDLESIPAELRGFAFEGAAMGFALLDLVSPWRSRRFAQFLGGIAGPHVYMAHVGAGWALARTSPRLAWRLGKLDPLLRWLMFDGYGFHEGYFHHDRAIDKQHRPHSLLGYELNAFDQGLGRSLWFVKGANVRATTTTVTSFPEPRRPDLWSGLGLAVAYAGGADADDIEALIAASGSHRASVAQGVAFAAKARERAGNLTPHTELTCQTICAMSAGAAAAATDDALPVIGHEDGGKAYERWRAEIRRRLEMR